MNSPTDKPYTDPLTATQIKQSENNSMNSIRNERLDAINTSVVNSAIKDSQTDSSNNQKDTKSMSHLNLKQKIEEMRRIQQETYLQEQI